MPSEPEVLGYLAGLLDGEGCITKQNGRWRVQIALTDEPVVRWLGTFGGRVSARKVYGNRKPSWRWLLMRQVDVHAFLVTLLPLLRIKRERSEEAIAEIASERLDELLALERVA